MSMHEQARVSRVRRKRVFVAEDAGDPRRRPLTASLPVDSPRTPAQQAIPTVLVSGEAVSLPSVSATPEDRDRQPLPRDPLRTLLGRVGQIVEGYLGRHSDLPPQEKEALRRYLATLSATVKTYDGEIARYHLKIPDGLREGLGRAFFEKDKTIAELARKIEALQQPIENPSEKRVISRVSTVFTGEDKPQQKSETPANAPAHTNEPADLDLQAQIAAVRATNRELELQLVYERAAVEALQAALSSKGVVPDETTRNYEEETKASAKKWLHTFTRLGVARGIRALRLDVEHEVLSIKDFARDRLFINEGQLGHLENGQLPTRLSLANIQERTLLKDFGDDSKAIQFLRLLSDVKGGFLKVFDRHDIETVKFGDFIRYFRVALGQSREQVAAIFTEANATLLGRGKDFLRSSEITTKVKFAILESNRSDESVAYKVKYLERIFAWLQLEEGHPLRDIFIQKANNQEVTIDDAVYQQLVDSRFLFDHPSHKDPLVVLSDIDIDFIAAIGQDPEMTIGAAIRMIREGLGQRQFDIMQETGISPSTVSPLELGKIKSLDQTLVEVLYGLDKNYTIHHPLVQLLLERADEERKDRTPAQEKEIVERICDLGFTHKQSHVVFDNTE